MTPPNEPVYIPPHHSQGLPLQAGEVAMFPRRSEWAAALRIALAFVVVFGALGLVITALSALR